MLGQMSLFAPDVTLPLRRRVSLDIISVADARYTLEKFHYLHRTRVGRQINYAVLIDGVVDGVITYAYPMMTASIHGVPSDEIIEFARLFLAQNIPHSATCAIGQSLKRIVADWMREFPDAKTPRLVVSWSDKEYHRGTIYKAANFEWLKVTHGDHRKGPRNQATCKRGFRAQHPDLAHDKDCWIYWLDKRPRSRITQDAPLFAEVHG